MDELKESYLHALEMNATRVPVFVESTMRGAIEEHERVVADLAALQTAACSMAAEAGILPRNADTSESMCGPMYQVELLREAELRFRRLSVQHEKMRAAVILVCDSEHSLTASGEALKALQEVLGE